MPDGDEGIKAPLGGAISEEHSYVVLSDGTIYCVFRTVQGHPACCYSRDGGYTFSKAEFKKFGDGTVMKHPRAANFVWKSDNNKYLYWFHNHGGKDYEDRNPVWVCGGIETDSPEGKVIKWSQPKILLYDDDPLIRISYPDLIIDDGEYYITETQKNIARVHKIDKNLISELWDEFEDNKQEQKTAIFEYNENKKELELPPINSFIVRDMQDFSYKSLRLITKVRFEFEINQLKAETLFQNLTKSRRGFCVSITAMNTIRLYLSDGITTGLFESDPFTSGLPLKVEIEIDNGPNIVTFKINGKLCDGGEERQFGFGRYSKDLRNINGSKKIWINDNINYLKIYNY